MSFRSVYRTLQEVFPQVDLRILKAVAIEHSTDVDAAVEFILLEVLPSLSAPQEESHTSSNIREESPEVKRRCQGFSSSPGNEEESSSLHAYPAQPAENFHGTDYTSTALHANSLRPEETIRDGSSVGFVAESKENISPLGLEEFHNLIARSKSSETVSPTCDNAFVNYTTNDSCSLPPLGESIVTHPVYVIRDGSISGDQLLSHEMLDTVQLDKMYLKPNAGSSSVSSLIQCEDNVVEWSSPPLADTQGLFELDVPSALRKTSQEGSLSESSLEENLVSTQPGLVAEESPRASFNGCQDDPLFSLNKDAELLVVGNESTIHDDHPVSTSTRSGNTVNIDFLEEFVTDCKGIKNILVSAMESAVVMMKEVDLREKEANLAKESASKAGLDMLEKVEDLKEMLKHAKEANNMHSGEVYGEKSILATEARELQARLLSLSDQRYKSLVIIEEIHQTLKARLVTAEEERIKAEQEKLEKEEQARKALVEQQEIMERVVQESKELQKEAEENSKLREFLMERGHLVDTLQGEISVICEDVLALKERVDGRLPLGRTLSSSQVLSSLASSTSSRASASSDKLPCPVEASEKQHITMSQETLKAQQVECSTKNGERSIIEAADRKAMSDDDWEYFDGEAELCR